MSRTLLKRCGLSMLLALSVLAACENTAAPGVAVATVEVAAVTDTLDVGETVQMSAVARDSSGAELSGRDIVWSLAPADTAATIDSAGVLTVTSSSRNAFAAPPVLTVRATSEGVSGETTVYVHRQPTSLAISASARVLSGATEQLQFQTLDEVTWLLPYRAPGDAQWSSSDPSVLEVSESGLLTAHAPGTSLVKATLAGVTDTFRIRVGGAGYSMTILDPSGSLELIATRLNDSGQVVGSMKVASGERHAFRWQAGAFEDLGAVPGRSNAFGLNNAGTVVGSAGVLDNDRGFQPVRWEDDELIPLFNPQATWWGNAVAVDESGRVLIDRSFNYRVPLLWENGDTVSLGPPSMAWLAVNDMNAAGTVAGSINDLSGIRATLLENGHLVSLAYSRAVADATDVNDAGQAVGYWLEHPIPRTHGFLWNAGETTELASGGWNGVFPFALNEQAQVVGAVTPPNGSTAGLLPDGSKVGFIWEDGELSLLTELLVTPGWTVTGAHGINPAGQILAEVQELATGAKNVALLTPAQ